MLIIAGSRSFGLYCGVMKPWQTCPLVSGVGKQDKRSIMPGPTKSVPTGVDHRNIVLQLTAPWRFESSLYSNEKQNPNLQSNGFVDLIKRHPQHGCLLLWAGPAPAAGAGYFSAEGPGPPSSAVGNPART
jgi:hypothetical protein